jgi:hypothetical protein
MIKLLDLGGVEPPARSTQNAQTGTFPQAHKTTTLDFVSKNHHDTHIAKK